MKHVGTRCPLAARTVGLGLVLVAAGAIPTLGQDSIPPVGIYTAIGSLSPDDPAAAMQILVGCTAAPIVIQPDGTVMHKRLTPGASGGVNPYATELSARCIMDGSRLACDTSTGVPRGDIETLVGGHLRFTPASGGAAEIWGRCDIAGLQSASIDGEIVAHIIAREDGGPVLLAADQLSADAASGAPDPGQDSMELSDGIFPPGVYTEVSFGSAEDMEYQRAIGCARQPVVFYPDGRMVDKELDPMRGEAGIPPYRTQLDGQCTLSAGVMECSATTYSPYGDAPEAMSITVPVRDLRNGDIAMDEGEGSGLLKCDLADLDQTIDGRNVLGEILRRDDWGPFPPIGSVVLDLEAYRGPRIVETARGPWHGAVNGRLEGGTIELSINIVQAADNPADAYGRHRFYVEGSCGALSEIACADLTALSGGNPETRGSRLVEGKLISAFAVENSFSPEDLRLSVVEKHADGTATFSVIHPDHGLVFSVTAPFEDHWCHSVEGNPQDEFCITTAGQLGALADPDKARQAHGMLGTDGNLLRPFFVHLPELANLFPEQGAEMVQPSGAAGALPVGVYANLLNFTPTPDWVAERCETSPTIFYPDGMVVSKVPGGAGYVVDQAIQCRPNGLGASCRFGDTSDGATDVAFDIFETAGGFQMCAQGDQICESFHQCTGDLIAPSVYAGLVARDDGGAPLPGK